MRAKEENTPIRENRRRYEERNKDKRRATSGNFQTMIPKADFDEINAFIAENNLTKVQFIKEAYELLKIKYTK